MHPSAAEGTVTLLFTDIEGSTALLERGRGLPRDKAIEAFFAIAVESAVA
jgi:class 3 adenylate cyclase